MGQGSPTGSVFVFFLKKTIFFLWSWCQCSPRTASALFFFFFALLNTFLSISVILSLSNRWQPLIYPEKQQQQHRTKMSHRSVIHFKPAAAKTLGHSFPVAFLISAKADVFFF